MSRPRLVHPALTRPAFTRRQFGALGLAGLALAACGRRASDAAAADGLLRVGLPGAPDSLDPFVAEFAVAAILLNQIHAPLDSYRPGQGLAAAWRANADATQWTATLRDGLLWSDGAPLTAEDIVWSFRHALAPGSLYPGAGDLLPIRGAAEAMAGAAPVESIGVRAADARTLVFDLTQNLGVFPQMMREFYPIAPQAFAAHGAAWARPGNFVGAGPYLPRAVTQLSITLERNPNYFAAAAVAIPVIEVSAIDDAGTRLRMFQAGDLDLMQDLPAEALGVPGIEPDIYDASRLTYLKPNHARPFLSDARVRRALALAIDRDFIAEALYRAYAAPAHTLIPGSPNAPDDMLMHRREEAIALIREAGAEGATFELLQSGGEREGLAVALADDWRKIGIGTTISRTDPTGLYAAVDEGRFDLALARFDRGLKSDPWRYLEPFAPGGFAANFGWDSPDLAAALNAIRAEPEAARRDALAYAAERALLDVQAVIPILHERAAWLAAPGVSDRGAGQPLFWADLARQ